jgi:hypothetical protein
MDRRRPAASSPPEPSSHLSNRPSAACAECGEPLPEGAEELCAYCYEAQFEPSRIRLGERLPGRRHFAR